MKIFSNKISNNKFGNKPLSLIIKNNPLNISRNNHKSYRSFSRKSKQTLLLSGDRRLHRHNFQLCLEEYLEIHRRL